MGLMPWIFITVIGLLLLVLGLFIYYRKDLRDRKADYRTFFIIGITWLPIGIVLEIYPLAAMGGVFLAVGLVNKDKWEKPKKWSELSKKEKKLKQILIIISSVLLLGGLVVFYLFARRAGMM
jgi:uncharacterized membrane protein YidH (DUF202 family)